MKQFGGGYDWTNISRTVLVVDDGNCTCGGLAGNVPGNMARCLGAIVGTGKGDFTAEFPGVDISGGNNYYYRLTECSDTTCPYKKPRRCLWACYRTQGWMTDMEIKPLPTLGGFTWGYHVGPYSEYDRATKSWSAAYKPMYWSNARHTVWYVPGAFGTAANIGADHDWFLVRKMDYFPITELLAVQMTLPLQHAYVHLVRERLATPLNSSVLWEMNALLVVQLQIIDFDQGTSIVNSPFEVCGPVGASMGASISGHMPPMCGPVGALEVCGPLGAGMRACGCMAWVGANCGAVGRGGGQPALHGRAGCQPPKGPRAQRSVGSTRVPTVKGLKVVWELHDAPARV